MCKKYQLFEPSYPVQQMDLHHIQRVCLGPFLWASLVEKLAVPAEDISPACKRMKPTSSVRRKHKVGARDPLFLVPGGRFLLALGPRPPVHLDQATQFTLQIWDFGVPGASIVSEPNLIGQIDTGIPRWHTRGVKVHVGDTSTTVLQVVVSSHYPGLNHESRWIARHNRLLLHRQLNLYRFVVVEADFLSIASTSVALRRVAELTLPASDGPEAWKIGALHGTRLLLRYQDLTFVWDCLGNTFTCSRLVGDLKVCYPNIHSLR
ncbi:hypothetical protein FA13DRAFT_143881 [Coprinellus micaceus]|uniref:Uncharacterized protein n=1 Tax=Coprinellus micaceus TaxID=71717 RepID=A0A4Y7SH72_COPMI|nr:hypothetical protein FA13DRAFT_143881 [Coprinellus micaceus]